MLQIILKTWRPKSTIILYNYIASQFVSHKFSTNDLQYLFTDFSGFIIQVVSAEYIEVAKSFFNFSFPYYLAS